MALYPNTNVVPMFTKIMKEFTSIEEILEYLNSSKLSNKNCMGFYNALYLFVKDLDPKIPKVQSKVFRILTIYSNLNNEIRSLYYKISTNKLN